MAEIDVAGLQQNKQASTEQVGEERELAPWELPDAPPGSTASSLMVYERGKPVRVHGPTHYHHLADGRVLAAYNGGTHYDDGEKVTRIIAVHAG